MKRLETLIAIAAAYALVVAGVVLQFGPYGLIGAGVFALAALTFVNPIDMPHGTKKE